MSQCRLWALMMALAGAGCVRAIDLHPSRDRGWPEASAGEGAARERLSASDRPREHQPGCDPLACPLGCNVTLGRCNRPRPSTFDPTPFHDQLAVAVSIASAATINTDSGQVAMGGNILRPPGYPGTVQQGIYWDLVSQGTGYPSLAIFAVGVLTIEPGASVAVTGPHALALYAGKDITLAGTVVAAPSGRTPGAGGFAGGATAAVGTPCFGGEGKRGSSNTADTFHSGGGGGGRKAAGGEGGSAGAQLAGAGGGANGNDTLVPLYGGCGGGGGGWGGQGGGGGGAIQLVAAGELIVSGKILVPGAGGKGGAAFSGAGGGGGSGGGVLLEGASVTVSGFIAANGGGGGGALDGQDGLPTASAAQGGTGSNVGGAGGAGGALGVEPGGVGANGPTGGVAARAGGGGGAAGRVRISGGRMAGSAGCSSPAASMGTVTAVW